MPYQEGLCKTPGGLRHINGDLIVTQENTIVTQQAIKAPALAQH
jgi:hypothetical protein